MIPKDCKRLAEVDFPIATVSKHALKEKSVRFGHPSTFHLWWARRPLGACRAMLLALSFPDPCDPHCPDSFRSEARDLLAQVQGRPRDEREDLRRGLLTFIGDFANWDLSANDRYVEVARGLVRAAHGGQAPLVVDPFSGGGSIPLEALRLGCEVFASDLNPVAAFILKVMLEDLPRSAAEFVERVEEAGRRVRQIAERRLKIFYPDGPDGSVPIAYVWARTVRCETSNCGAEIPIYRSPWLSRRGATRARYFKEAPDGRCAALLIESAPRGGPVTFRIATGAGSEEPRSGFVKLDGTKATGNNADVICPCCKSVLPGNKKNPRVPLQLAQQHGGADVILDSQGRRVGGAKLLAVALLGDGNEARSFRLPTDADYVAARNACDALEEAAKARSIGGLSRVPDEPLPSPGTLGFRVQRYGMVRWGDLFNARQKLAMLVLCDAIEEVALDDPAIREILALALSRFADISNASCRWENTKTQVRNLFTRQAIPIVWDFAEPAIFAEQAGDYHVTLNTMLRVMKTLPRTGEAGQVQIADACASPLPDEAAHVWFTDPPYYDAVPYSDLSDFFFVWLKRAFPGHPLLRDPFDPTNPLTPKDREAVQDEVKIIDGKPKDKAFFESAMACAFAEGRRVLREDGVGCVVFAHKTTEGWEALLSGMIRGRWVITGSWPIATESATRLRARESAALATSVHLICRPRPDDAQVGDWAGVLRELPDRVGDWMERLQGEGIRGADLVFACIGPALEIFSRYKSVEAADGREVKLAEYLEKVWEVVGRSALAQVLGTADARARNGAAGAVEEDARLTALFLWTLQSTNPSTELGAGGETEDSASHEGEDEDDDEESSSRGKAKGFTLVFDIVRRFAQPLGIELPKWEGRVIETRKGVVRLLPLAERAKQLFGEDGAQAVAARLEQETTTTNPLQGMLFPDMQPSAVPAIKGSGRGFRKRAGVDVSDESLAAAREATTLDRVHAAMLLQAAGRTNALRALLKAEQERGPDFIRLANALSALYPKGSEEKRLLDAMLLAVPR
jgi:adenine-specific DNA methylase